MTALRWLAWRGAIVLGKMNCDDLSMGSSNDSVWPSAQPRDKSRVPGGPAVARRAALRGTTVATLGSDTGESIRQPASFCGVVGLMPTYGRVSR